MVGSVGGLGSAVAGDGLNGSLPLLPSWVMG